DVLRAEKYPVVTHFSAAAQAFSLSTLSGVAMTAAEHHQAGVPIRSIGAMSDRRETERSVQTSCGTVDIRCQQPDTTLYDASEPFCENRVAESTEVVCRIAGQEEEREGVIQGRGLRCQSFRQLLGPGVLLLSPLPRVPVGKAHQATVRTSGDRDEVTS